MTQIQKTRERGLALTGSPKVFSGGNSSEDSSSTLSHQSRWLAARYNMGAAHARAVAELAFARRPQR